VSQSNANGLWSDCASNVAGARAQSLSNCRIGTVDSHVKKLRRKIADLLPGRELIHSVYGVGYKLE